VVYAGSLDAPAAPTAAGGQMYTLEQIYNRINDGTAATKMTTFGESSSGPSAGTGRTLDEIHALAGQRARAPKTGQARSDAAGDDGALLKGVDWPVPRFTAHVDNNGDGDCTDEGETCNGTVTDNLTGLIWLRNVNCPNSVRDWSTALSDVTQLNTNGTMNGSNCGDTSNGGSHQTDWRLPNVRELRSLIHYGVISPAVPNTAGTGQWTTEGDPFTGVTSSYYWSATTYTGDMSNAWIVSFYDGHDLPALKTREEFYVWPVRGGQ